MTTLFPCHADADGAIAADLAAFLENGAGVRVFLEDGVMGRGETLVAKARDGRMADIVVVLLSRNSVPDKWVREDWEEAFLAGPAADRVRIAFLLLDDCSFPAILRREAFFTDRRALKRWIRGGARQRSSTPPRLESLVEFLADRPGIARSELAAEFADHCEDDFDAVLWLRCGSRTLAQLAGDLGRQLGLRLDGEPPANVERIRRFCRDRRFLIVLEEAATPEAMELVCDGATSTLLTDEPVRPYEPSGLEAIEEAFASALPLDWNAACSLARRGVTAAREQDRLAEAFEIMQSLYNAAKLCDDRRVVEEAAREQIWILEHWDRLDEADVLRRELGFRYASQLSLEFS